MADEKIEARRPFKVNNVMSFIPEAQLASPTPDMPLHDPRTRVHATLKTLPNQERYPYSESSKLDTPRGKRQEADLPLHSWRF